MKKSQKSSDKTVKEEMLKGTFVSVMLLGAFLIITWAAVFVLFISRS